VTEVKIEVMTVVIQKQKEVTASNKK